MAVEQSTDSVVSFMGKLDPVTALVIAAYLGAVIYRGNINELLKLLSGELSFLELLIAIMALNFLMDNKTIGPLVKPLVAIAIIGVIIRAASHTDFVTIADNFAKGRVGLFGTIKALFMKG